MAESSALDPANLAEIPTPALVVDRSAFDANRATMDEALPGRALRPHVKAFKSTALAAVLAADGHTGFCAATPREIEGMALAGLGEDLLLANETLDTERLGRLRDRASVTVAIDSPETLAAAVAGGIERVLIDVDVGLPRCGCLAEDAGPLADQARAAGIEVRGVMGYEGHLMMVLDRAEQAARVEKSMARLIAAHEAVGGDIVSGGGTGTYDINRWVSEIQAGSYLLMDTHYDQLGLPFVKSLAVVGTVISVSKRGWAVVDAGLKAFGLDHGNPVWPDGELLFCSDEHTTLKLDDDAPDLSVGDRVRLWPSHVDPTVARHEQFWVVDGPGPEAAVVDRWPIDLRHW